MADKLKVDDLVVILAKSKKYNPHIYNVGMIGQIVELWEDGVQLECISGGTGAVDRNVVAPIPEPNESIKKAQIRWYKMTNAERAISNMTIQ